MYGYSGWLQWSLRILRKVTSKSIIITPQECATPDTLSMGYGDSENCHHVVQYRSCTFPAPSAELHTLGGYNNYTLGGYNNYTLGGYNNYTLGVTIIILLGVIIILLGAIIILLGVIIILLVLAAAVLHYLHVHTRNGMHALRNVYFWNALQANRPTTNAC